MKTQFKDLNEGVNFYPGDVIVLGSRSGMGKSCFLRDIAFYDYLDGKKTIIWSEEHSTIESFVQLLCWQSEVERSKVGEFYKEDETSEVLRKIQKHQIESMNKGDCGSSVNGVEYQRLSGAFSEFERGKEDIYFEKTCKERNIDQFLDDLLEANEETLVVIDTIQMAASLAFQNEELSFSIPKLMTKIKFIATETNSIFFISSQISRKVEERPGRKPCLTDLSDSSALEEIADKVMFLLRRDVYDPLDKPGQAELIILKNRNGPQAIVTLTFRKEFGQFANFVPFSYSPGGGSEFDEEAFSAFSPE